MKEIITFAPSLKKPCKMVSVEEGLKIADELFEILKDTETGIGLAANQVGIDARVAVVNVIEPLVASSPSVFTVLKIY